VTDDVVGAEVQVRHGDVLLDRIAGAVDAALAKAREVHDGFAQCFGWNGAGVDANAADDRGALDDQHAAAQLRGLNGGALPGGAGANHHKVVIKGRHEVPQNASQRIPVQFPSRLRCVSPRNRSTGVLGKFMELLGFLWGRKHPAFERRALSVLMHATIIRMSSYIHWRSWQGNGQLRATLSSPMPSLRQSGAYQNGGPICVSAAVTSWSAPS